MGKSLKKKTHFEIVQERLNPGKEAYQKRFQDTSISSQKSLFNSINSHQKINQRVQGNKKV